MKARLVVLSCASLLCAAHTALAEVTVASAWVRPTVPGQTVAGAYLKITSTSQAYLVGGSSPVAKTVEVHEMSMTDNVMKMRPVKRLELPAGKTVELKPGSYHLMMIDVVHPLKTGDKVPLTLTVEEGGKKRAVEVTASVGELTATGAAHGGK